MNNPAQAEFGWGTLKGKMNAIVWAARPNPPSHSILTIFVSSEASKKRKRARAIWAADARRTALPRSLLRPTQFDLEHAMFDSWVWS